MSSSDRGNRSSRSGIVIERTRADPTAIAQHAGEAIGYASATRGAGIDPVESLIRVAGESSTAG